MANASILNEEKLVKPPKESKWYLLLLYILPLAIYAWFGLQHITKFETADEHFWINEDTYNINTKKTIVARIPQYWKAMQSKDWAHTDINDKPGISLAIISGLGQYIHGGWADRIIEQMDWSQIYDPEKSERMNFSFRVPLLIFNGLISIFILIALKRISQNAWFALLGASLIVLSPVLVGISQIVNPDALLWSFAISSLLSWILFVQKNKWWDAVITVIMLGFAFLTKYTSVILIPFLFVLMIVYLFYYYGDLQEQGNFRKKSIILFLTYPLVIAFAVLVFALGLPAVFLEPSALWDGVSQIGNFFNIMWILIYADAALVIDAIILKSFLLKNLLRYTQILKKIFPRLLYIALAAGVAIIVINWGWKNNFLNIPNIQYDDRKIDSLFAQINLQTKIVLELFPLIFSLTPIVLTGIFVALLKFTIWRDDKDEFILFSLIAFFVAFYSGVIMQNLLVNVRYSVLMYPIFILMAALGLAVIFKWNRLNDYMRLVLFLIVIGISSYNLWLSKPFYFNYANDILPKDHITSGGWGYGAYEAAQFINAQATDPSQLYVWTDYEGFCPFIPGRCFKGSQIKWNKKVDTDNIDYYVTSRRGMMLSTQMWATLSDRVSEKPVWELNIDGRPDNFIRVYKNIKKSDSVQ